MATAGGTRPAGSMHPPSLKLRRDKSPRRLTISREEHPRSILNPMKRGQARARRDAGHRPAP